MKDVNQPQAASNPEQVAQALQEGSGQARSLIEGHMKNLDLMSEAMRASVRNANTVLQCHQEIIRNTIEQGCAISHDKAGTASSGASMAAQREMLRTAFQSGLPNARDLTQMTESLNREVYEVVRRRMAERVEEARRPAPAPPKVEETLPEKDGAK